MKPKLLVVTSTFPRWVDDTDPPFVYELSRRLTADFQITVHTPGYPGALSKERMGGLTVYRFRYFLKPFEKLAGSIGILPTLRLNKLYYLVVPFFLVSQFISLLWLVRKIRPDVIHAHWIIPQGVVGAIVSFFYGVPVVLTAHGGDLFGLQGKLMLWVKALVLNRAQAVTTVSKALAGVVSKLSSKGIEPQVIPMGVDSRAFSPEHRSPVIKEQYGIRGQLLLYVGRLTEKKGVCFLLEAMPRILEHFGDAGLIIIGQGELEYKLRQYAKGLGLGSSVHFINGLPQAELPAFYATADIFVGPSITIKGGDTEGFGLTFVEAAMSGCLVVASEVGGVTDTIIDGKTGFLVRPGDADEIAETVIYLLKNPELVKLKTHKTRVRCVEKFDWDSIATKYANIMNKVRLQDGK